MELNMNEQIIEVDGPAPQVGEWYAGRDDAAEYVCQVLTITSVNERGPAFVIVAIYNKEGRCSDYNATDTTDSDFNWSAPIPAPEWYKPIRLVRRRKKTDAEIVAEAMGWELKNETASAAYFVFAEGGSLYFKQSQIARLASALKKGGAK